MENLIQTQGINVVLYPAKGTFDILSREKNTIVIKNACCSLSCTINSEKKTFNTINQGFTIISGPFAGNLGKGTKYRLDFMKKNESDPIHFQLDLIQYKNLPSIFFELIVTNDSNHEIKLHNISGLTVNSRAEEKGGVFISDCPDEALVYENGLGFALEFFMRSFSARMESESSLMQFIYSKRQMSNNLLVGLINPNSYLYEVVSNEENDKGIIIDGREGIAEYQAQIVFPFPKTLPPKDSISAGKWVIMIDSKNGFEALEDYADIIRIHNNIRLWPHSIPHGWNSWGNPVEGYREYSYVHDISEKVILDNLEVAVKYLKRFGLEYWQLDEGYCDDRMLIDENQLDLFPHGVKYIADKIHEKGLKAGIWINPFNIGIRAALIKEHPDWFPSPDPSFVIKNNKWRSLDISIPECQNYLRHFIRKVVKEWGFDLLKVDFSYMNMAPSKFFNPLMTSPELHRLGWQIIREEAGRDVFVFGIGGPLGLHIGDLDGERVSLDTLPVWANKGVPQHMFDIPQTDGSVVYNYRTMIRKFFLNNRVWFNHLDCLCFRPSLKRDETLCLANAIALMGGIFKIGDKLVEMKEEDLKVIQRMLPIYKGYAKPADVFRMLLPEIINLPIKKDFLNWNVVGLFNWGDNRDLIEDKDLPSEEKYINIRFHEDLQLDKGNKYHIFDFWNEKYFGLHFEQFAYKLEPHTSVILSIHQELNYPQFLSSNRHITQGGVELLDFVWDPLLNQIEMILSMVPKYEHHLFFHVPPKYRLDIINSKQSSDIKQDLNENILKLSIITEEPQLNVKIKFQLS